jgi:hypothetical protein
VTGLDPSPLDELQEPSLKNRYRLDESGDEGDEAQTLKEVHWRIQPRWLKFATLVAVPPLALLWGYMVRSGQALEHESLMLEVFSLIGAVILSHFFFIIRAYWRMDI